MSNSLLPVSQSGENHVIILNYLALDMVHEKSTDFDALLSINTSFEQFITKII